jgi:hypothetical protein
MSNLLLIRTATAADEQELTRLAALDSARPLTGDILVAHTGGAIIAAVSVDDGRVIADPFVLSFDTVAVLQLRARQERAAEYRSRPAHLRGLALAS